MNALVVPLSAVLFACPLFFFNIRLPVCAKKCTFVRYFCIEVHNRKKTTSLTNPNL